MALRGTLCGAWSFLLAATNTKTALPFPLCCKRHAFSLHIEERDTKSTSAMTECRKEIWIIIYRYKLYHKKIKILTKIYIYANYIKDNLCLALQHITLLTHDLATAPWKLEEYSRRPSGVFQCINFIFFFFFLIDQCKLFIRSKRLQHFLAHLIDKK